LVKRAGAAATVRAPLASSSPEMLTVSGGAACSGITEKTIRKAIKDGRLAYTVDTSPGPWPRQGRYLIRRSDLEFFKMNSYDPYFKKGRWVRARHEQKLTLGSVVAFAEPKEPSGNKYSMSPCSSRVNRVIPVTVEAMPFEAHRGHLGVRHSDPARIVAAIQL
jgi:hypothetical protein